MKEVIMTPEQKRRFKIQMLTNRRTDYINAIRYEQQLINSGTLSPKDEAKINKLINAYSSGLTDTNNKLKLLMEGESE
jgi:hypothetical protein